MNMAITVERLQQTESDKDIRDIGDEPNEEGSVCLHYFRLSDVAA